MTQGLIDAHGALPKLMPFVHLPVQSGSDRMLKAMNRRHRAQTISTSSRGCARRGPISRSPRISSSAFPAKPTPISRRRWRSFARSVSPRPSRSNIRRAPARRAPSAKTRSTRRDHARAPRDAAGAGRRRSGRPSTPRRSGAIVDVLFEKPGRHDGQIAGKSPYMQAVHVDGAARTGWPRRAGRKSSPPAPIRSSGEIVARSGAGIDGQWRRVRRGTGAARRRKPDAEITLGLRRQPPCVARVRPSTTRTSPRSSGACASPASPTAITSR